MKFILIIFLILFVYSVIIEPNILTVKRIKIKDEKLKGLKVIFASDFHFKPYEKYRLLRIVKRINFLNPDIILLGGDYVNGHKRGNTLDINIIAENLGRLKSKYGTFAVMGNHDGWQGKKDIIEKFAKAGITVLENAAVNAGGVSIAGVEDLQTGNPDINKALKDAQNPVIFLSHTPDIIKDVPAVIHLLLCGHTHGGQAVIVKPIIVPSKYGTKYAYGLFEENGVKMFVSRGLGTSILPLRFNSFPEIVVIEFS